LRAGRLCIIKSRKGKYKKRTKRGHLTKLG
jgi:hypothetical protein